MWGISPREGKGESYFIELACPQSDATTESIITKINTINKCYCTPVLRISETQWHICVIL